VPVNASQPDGTLDRRHRRMAPSKAAASASYDHLTAAMRLQLASPTVADMQRLQDLIGGLVFTDEVKPGHRQLQRTSQIRISEERYPGTSAVWQSAFLITYGKPTHPEREDGLGEDPAQGRGDLLSCACSLSMPAGSQQA
jgi:hypothetical protein